MPKEHEEKIAAGEISVPKTRFRLWLENYWYHYKWQTLCVLFAIFVLLVCFVQCSNRETSDGVVVYAGGYTLNEEEKSRLRDVLESVSPASGGNEKRFDVSLASYSIFTEDELIRNNTDGDGKKDPYSFQMAKTYNSDNMTAFSNLMMAGESAVFLVSPYVYQSQNMVGKMAMPLSELFAGGEIPASAYDGYAIRLADTDFYRYYDAVKVLPADTLLVFSRQYVVGSIADDARYAQFRDLYFGIVNFRIP